MPQGIRLAVSSTDGVTTDDNLNFTGGTFINNGTINIDLTDTLSKPKAAELLQINKQARVDIALTYTLTVSFEADATDSGSRTVIYTIYCTLNKSITTP